LAQATNDTPKRDKILAAGRAGVLDIGSNSVRLVIYEGPHRALSPDFNEKALCAIGKGIATTGRLDPQGANAAIKALIRFRMIAELRGVKRVDAVATAAVRDASNGADFIQRARDALGVPIRVLSGEDEARLAAEGVIGGIPDADGIVGDLGGGSLELTPVERGQALPGVSLPFGPLRLMDASDNKLDKARDVVDQGLGQLRVLDRLRNRALYAVGGVWRSIARIHMTRAKHPVQVLHAYTMSREDALEHSEFLSSKTRRAMEFIEAETKRRAETVPFGAVVMERLIKATKLDRIVVSSYGVREGVLFQKMPDDVRLQDPLLAAVRDWALREARDPALEDALFQWTQSLFSHEAAEDARLRRAACALSDVLWRGHPDHRSEAVFHMALNGNFTGIDHRGRGMLALALHHRYAGLDAAPANYSRLSTFLGDDACSWAMVLGAGLRLAYAIAGPSADIVKQTSLRVTASGLILAMPRALEPLWCETVERKLADVASAMRKTPRIELR
jgi:exopolyphosphatase / guanosine-5'-triphosphate,3'-diphosphate pyrophosphatase